MATVTHDNDVQSDASLLDEALHELEYHALMGVAEGDEPVHENPRPLSGTVPPLARPGMAFTKSGP